MNPVLTALLVSLDTREKLPIGAKKQTEHSCHLCLVTLVDVNYCVTSGATLRHINGSNVVAPSSGTFSDYMWSAVVTVTTQVARHYLFCYAMLPFAVYNSNAHLFKWCSE